MERRERRYRPTRTVAVAFEPSHLAKECLADAYEYAVPVTRRRSRGGHRRPAATITDAARYPEGAYR